MARQSLRLLAIGLAVGLAGGVAVGFAMRGMLFGTSPADPVTLAGVTALLVDRVADRDGDAGVARVADRSGDRAARRVGYGVRSSHTFASSTITSTAFSMSCTETHSSRE